MGCEAEVTIRELAEAAAKVVGYAGKLTFDTSKPDGTPRKLMDSARMFALGWKPKVGLEEGIRRSLEDYLHMRANAKA